VFASWVRRDFGGAVGVTQYKPGRHLEAVQDHFRGRALLCIDVSPSMEGARLRAAIDGGLDFLTEAREARYECGLVLWDFGVVAHLRTTSSVDAVRRRLRSASIGNGTALAPTIQAAIKELGPMGGDRVVCVFSDGAIVDPEPTAKLAARARGMGIRFVVRGLGPGAGGGLARVLRPEGDEVSQTIDDVKDMRRGIASMVRDLRAGR
jgi:Mg-chelatase subunit ChlD